MGNMASNLQVDPPRTEVFSFYHFCCWYAHCCKFVSTKQQSGGFPSRTHLCASSVTQGQSLLLTWAQALEEACRSHFSPFSIRSDCNAVRAAGTLNRADWIRPLSRPSSSPAASAPCCVSVLWAGHRSRRSRCYVFINTSSSWSPEEPLCTSSPPEPTVGLVHQPGCFLFLMMQVSRSRNHEVSAHHTFQVCGLGRKKTFFLKDAMKSH